MKEHYNCKLLELKYTFVKFMGELILILRDPYENGNVEVQSGGGGGAFSDELALVPLVPSRCLS